MKKISFALFLFACILLAANAQNPTTVPDTTETDEIFNYVAKMPEFPGGIAALNQYLFTHVTYPSAARDAGAEGMVLVQFVVEKDGSVSNVFPVVTAYPALDEEAVRVISGLPRWIPGEDSNGEKVRVYYNLPIRFQLEPSKQLSKKEKKRKRK